MKTECVDIEQWLFAFLDGVAGEEERAAIEDHLENCPSCRADAARIAAIEGRVRSAYAAETPPAALWRRISADLAANEPVTVDRRRWLRSAVAASVVLAVGAVGVYGIGVLRRTPPGVRLMTVPVDELRAFVDSQRPCDIVTGDPAVLNAWFAGRLPFTAPPAPATSERLQLVGGRLCFFFERRIASYMYRCDERVSSLFGMDDSGLGEPDVDRTAIAGRLAWVHADVGWTHLAWREGGVRYSLVGDLEAAGLQIVAERMVGARRADGGSTLFRRDA